MYASLRALRSFASPQTLSFFHRGALQGRGVLSAKHLVINEINALALEKLASRGVKLHDYVRVDSIQGAHTPITATTLWSSCMVLVLAGSHPTSFAWHVVQQSYRFETSLLQQDCAMAIELLLNGVCRKPWTST